MSRFQNNRSSSGSRGVRELVFAMLIATISVAVILISLFQYAKLNDLPTSTPTLTPIQLDATWTVTSSQVATETPTLLPTYTFEPSATPFSLITPNPTQILQAAFSDIDSQLKNSLKGNIAFNKPEQMKKDETTSIELILSPSLSEPSLAAQLVDQGGFVTSTAAPNVLIAPNGEAVTVQTSQIEITPRMKAVLKSQNPEVFIITEMHDSAEQIVSSVKTTEWRWSVTAKKEGFHIMELSIYQLVKYDGTEHWSEVATYKAAIVVEVTLGDRVKSLDWYWIAGFIVTLVGAALGVLKWLDERKKKAAGSKPSAPIRRIK